MRKHLLPLSRKNEAQISAQIEKWRKRSAEPEPEKAPPFITISRQFGCGAYPLAEAIAAKLMALDGGGRPWAVYDKALVEKIAEDNQLSEQLVANLSVNMRTEMEESVLGLLKHFTPELKVYRLMVSTIRTLAALGGVIIVGRGGALLTKDLPGGLHVRLIAPLEWRMEQTMKAMDQPRQGAKDIIQKMDDEREAFLKKYLSADSNNPNNYHLILNMAKMSKEQMVDCIAGALR